MWWVGYLRWWGWVSFLVSFLGSVKRTGGVHAGRCDSSYWYLNENGYHLHVYLNANDSYLESRAVLLFLFFEYQVN